MRWCRTLADILLLRPAVSSLHGVKVSRLDLTPQTTRYLAVTQLAESVAPGRPVSLTTVAMSTTGLLIWANDLILSVLDRLASKNIVEFMTARVLVRPLPDGFEHGSLDLDTLVTDCWMVEGAEDIVDNFVDGHTGMFPGIEYAGDGVFEYVCRNPAGTRVQDVGEVVLGEHRVRWVCALRVFPGL